MPTELTRLDLSDSGFVTVEEAAGILGTSRQYVWRLAHRAGGLKRYKMGGRTSMTFFRRLDVEAYRDSHPKLGTSPRLGYRAQPE